MYIAIITIIAIIIICSHHVLHHARSLDFALRATSEDRDAIQVCDNIN